jgi:uroporphyrinogen decarboxylase
MQYDMIAHPLSEATVDDIERHNWPDPLDEGRYVGLREQAKELKENTDYAVIATTVDSGFFERSWYVCGWERFFTSLVAEPTFAVALMEKICDIQMQRWDRFLQEVGQYADVIAIGDDIAIHNSPVMSPEMYRKIVKPIQAKFYRFIKERTDAKLLYHSCGNVSPLIDDLIEIGVDALNPVQVSAVDMDSKQLNKRFGGKICFWGGIDTQRVLPFGSPDDVRAEVRRRIADLAPGYVLSAVHNIQDDVSPENICAMLY